MWPFKRKKKAIFKGKINHAQLCEGGQLSPGPIYNVTAYDEIFKDHIEITSLNVGKFRNGLISVTKMKAQEAKNAMEKEKNEKRIMIIVKEL